MKLRISETFDTIQGEGMLAGMPSHFIRTSGCNLRCWWCDTPYTSWKPEGSMESVTELARAAGESKCHNVVITGGEPMLFPNEVGLLTNILQSEHGKVVTIETNGTIYNDVVRPDLWSVSPKLSGSSPQPQQQREHDLHLANIEAAPLGLFKGRRATQYKFVISRPEELDEVEGMIREHNLRPIDVWLMPEGTTKEKILDGGLRLVEYCKSTGYNLCLRQHVLLWGYKRGV